MRSEMNSEEENRNFRKHVNDKYNINRTKTNLNFTNVSQLHVFYCRLETSFPFVRWNPLREIIDFVVSSSSYFRRSLSSDTRIFYGFIPPLYRCPAAGPLIYHYGVSSGVIIEMYNTTATQTITSDVSRVSWAHFNVFNGCLTLVTRTANKTKINLRMCV